LDVGARVALVRGVVPSQQETIVLKPLSLVGLFCVAVPLWSVPSSRAAEPLPGTKALTDEGNLSAKQVAGMHKYLDRALKDAVKLPPRGAKFFDVRLDPKAIEAVNVPALRDNLRKSLGVIDPRVPFTDLDYVSSTGSPALVADTETYKVFAVRWPVLPGIDAEGLLLEPKGIAKMCVVALPDADWTPEMLVGLVPGLKPENQFARWLAECGCKVLVPTLIDRGDALSASPKLGRGTNQPHREFVYRMAYQMGRHIVGYEIQKVLAAVDWFVKAHRDLPVAVYGYGEGGAIALFSAALDQRVKTAVVSGYFWPLPDSWEEPIYRNVWGLQSALGPAVRALGPAGVLLLIAPNALVVEWVDWPAVSGPRQPHAGRGGAAPGGLKTPDVLRNEVGGELFLKGETARVGVDARVTLPASGAELQLKLSVVRAATGPGCVALHNDLRPFLNTEIKLPKDRRSVKPPTDARKDFDPAARHKRQFEQLVSYTQKLWRDSDATRKAYWAKADASSPAAWEKSCDTLRDYFHTDVIGKLPEMTVPPNVRTRQVYDEKTWTGHEVVIDCYEDVFAYGILLLPKDLKPGEKRPVVVCQHGLEGTPRDTIEVEKRPVYNHFSRRLVELGYIVYAPQNPYYGKNEFRQLQRKANPLKLSLFSFIIRQHQRTIDWLEALPNVDPKRIAFYGLSYGGKTAMRVPAVEKRYCLSICSGDFNEWIGKNVSVDLDRSYMWTGEYEMYEFDLGNTFNYAEMAHLIAPRPFMVERGHDDGVGTDEMVAYEFAKVRYLYANRLKVSERTAIEWFVGGHQVNAKETFAFLKKHLDFPK
jgi:dienelactone hydrolase